MFMATLILSTQALFAAPANMELEVAVEDVEFDAVAFEAEFDELNEVEELVVTNEITSLEELSSLDASIDMTSFKSVNSVEGTQGFQWSNFDWPSGLWGFLCCPIGFFVVITNKNKTSDQKTSFWIGLAASVVLSAITSPFYYSY